jgi:hypothetical protein
MKSSVGLRLTMARFGVPTQTREFPRLRARLSPPSYHARRSLMIFLTNLTATP